MSFEQPSLENGDVALSPEKVNIEDIEKIKDAIIKNENTLSEQKEQLSAKIKGFISQKEKEGWNVFNYNSDNMGHSEIDNDRVYLFDSSVDISQWKNANFAEGRSSSSEDVDKFDEWLESISEEKYFDFPRYQVDNY